MELIEFKKRFKIAACFCRDFTDKYITDTLPKAICFQFLGKASTLAAKDVVASLFKEGAVPVWVDFYVCDYDAAVTTIKVTYSDDFTLDASQYYHQHEGIPPFHVVGPTIPEQWTSLEKDGPFELKQFT